MHPKSLLVVSLLFAIPCAAFAGDWPQFRGPAGNGVSEETNVPQVWGPDKNIRWKVPLPGPGDSSPIVSGKRVFITCATDRGKNRSLYCFDRDTGKELWVKTVEFSGVEPTHPTNQYCGSSPAADGQRVFVWHSSAGLHCYDYDGNLLWSRDLGTFKHIWGYGASPVLYKDKLLLNCGPGVRTFVIALDRESGKTLWQTDEPGGASGEKEDGTDKVVWNGSWSTPAITKVDGQDQILVGMPRHLNAYDPETGKIVWTCDGLGDLVYTSPMISEGVAIAMSGYHGPAIGCKLRGTGNVTESNRLWQKTAKNPQRIGTGIIVGKNLFMANEQGIAQCLDVTTGDDRWTSRLPGGAIWGSLLLAEGRFYVTNQQGTTLVFQPNADQLELLQENKLGEMSNSTPAFSDGQIFIRTFKHLYCIQEAAAP